MISNKKQKEIVRAYIRQHLSAKQISEKFSLSETTITYYLKKNGVQKRSISEGVRQMYITKHGKKEFLLKKKLSKQDERLKIAGAMLYWGEGAKTHGMVKFANSDPEMIRLFLKFLRIICGVDRNRIKALIHMYPDHDKENLLSFWIQHTGISRTNFYKPYIHVGKSGTYKIKSRYGTLAISYSDGKLLQTILSWVESYKVSL